MLAIVPVRGLSEGKTRLAPDVSPGERASLVESMLHCVLAACRASAAVDATLVVTPDARVAGGDDVLIDEGAGHASAIALALRDPRARSGALVVMADCPLAQPESLDALAAAARPAALVPARDGGVNALALWEPGLFEPAFGVPDGARVTVERARAAGIEPAVLDDPLLAFDVDVPADLELLRQVLAPA